MKRKDAPRATDGAPLQVHTPPEHSLDNSPRPLTEFRLEDSQRVREMEAHRLRQPQVPSAAYVAHRLTGTAPGLDKLELVRTDAWGCAMHDELIAGYMRGQIAGTAGPGFLMLNRVQADAHLAAQEWPPAMPSTVLFFADVGRHGIERAAAERIGELVLTWLQAEPETEPDLAAYVERLMLPEYRLEKSDGSIWGRAFYERHARKAAKQAGRKFKRGAKSCFSHSSKNDNSGRKALSRLTRISAFYIPPK